LKEETKRKVPVTSSSSKRDALDLEEAQIDGEDWKGDDEDEDEDDEGIEIDEEEDDEEEEDGDEVMEGEEGEGAEKKAKDPEG